MDAYSENHVLASILKIFFAVVVGVPKMSSLRCHREMGVVTKLDMLGPPYARARIVESPFPSIPRLASSFPH
jgi:hypothetical protein